MPDPLTYVKTQGAIIAMVTVRTIARTADTPTRVGIMKRRGVTGNLATVGDLADMIGRSRQTALSYSQRFDFPVPLDVLNPDTRPMAVWWRKDIEKWVADNPDAKGEGL
jgi:hypothetical protein